MHCQFTTSFLLFLSMLLKCSSHFILHTIIVTKYALISSQANVVNRQSIMFFVWWCSLSRSSSHEKILTGNLKIDLLVIFNH